MQEQRLAPANAHPDIDPGTFTAGNRDCEESSIDNITLAGLDIGLFKCLSNIGTSRQRICSALCLSYAEYDYISRHLKAL